MAEQSSTARSDPHPSYQPHIVPEDDHELYDDDSDGASIESSTASLSSSIMNYRYGHYLDSKCAPASNLQADMNPMMNESKIGWTWYASLWLPAVIQAVSYCCQHHHIWSMITGGDLYRAPLPPGVSKILDLGTGTGSWAIDVAELPPNCKFEIDDFESPWNFTQPFDFVHVRNIEGSVKDYPRLFKQALANLEPGGWFEVADSTVGLFGDDDTIEKATSLSEWRDRLIEASGKFGKPMGVSHNYKQWMIDAGFENVTEELYKVPFSPWAKDRKLKELGRYQQAMMLEALEAYSLALFTRVLGWNVARIQLLLVGVRKELMDRSLHIYSRYYIVYGQKPKAS
ncbi:conserved hypothetical protein [Uncinocarpus reesii 1704]|uniref:Methyltransferase n=1 Tax=Uncinocarpus reesii (strain UAMH 1704) TaxID=336963 RepID=C4JKY7_UNCRE|nr:uncharacterized protein UREG_00187 [Uncinocarpus reesii 1704]EEP75341.1 conserved hypothetical protein [Uncinocarpus reesii 1704]